MISLLRNHFMNGLKGLVSTTSKVAGSQASARIEPTLDKSFADSVCDLPSFNSTNTRCLPSGGNAASFTATAEAMADSHGRRAPVLSASEPAQPSLF